MASWRLKESQFPGSTFDFWDTHGGWIMIRDVSRPVGSIQRNLMEVAADSAAFGKDAEFKGCRLFTRVDAQV
jgi:hypothetical protein